MKTRRVGLFALVLFLPIVNACGGHRVGRLDPVGRLECPHDWSTSQSLVDALGREVVPALGPRLRIPEFHDCQRFLDGTGGYGGLFAIFALPDLATKPPSGSFVSRAIIVDFEGQGYQSLNLQQSGSGATVVTCLLVSAGPPWEAMVVPVSPQVDCIGQRTYSAPSGQGLNVTSYQSGSYGLPDDYPAAARWDQDDSEGTGNYNIGISCGNEWCTIGSSPPNPTFHQRGGKPSGAPDQRVTDIKGWYDEQTLARVPQGQADPRPSNVRGWIVPSVDLGTKNSLNDFKEEWVVVARVALDSGQDTTYLHKFNFAHTGVSEGQTYNRIEVCYDDPNSPPSCPNLGPLEGGCTCEASTSDCDDDNWYARLLSADPSRAPMFRGLCRYQMDPAVYEVPATARWRWLATDEGAWFRCVNGCCELVDGEN